MPRRMFKTMKPHVSFDKTASVSFIFTNQPCLAMDVDSKKPSSGRIEKKRVDKRKQKASKIVFKSYGSRSKGKKKSS